jgi:signal transduction histidine kinase
LRAEGARDEHHFDASDWLARRYEICFNSNDATPGHSEGRALRRWLHITRHRALDAERGRRALPAGAAEHHVVLPVTIRSKLAVGLLAITLVLLFPLLLALRSLEALHDVTTVLQKREFAASLLLNKMRAGTDELRRLDLSLVFVHQPQIRASMDSQLTVLSATADSLSHLGMSDASASIGGAVARVASFVPVEYEAAAQGHGKIADSVSTQHLIPAITAMERELTAAESILRDRSSRLVAQATAKTEQARNAAALGLAVAATLAFIISVLLWRTIGSPIRDLELGMAAVADGNFGYRLRVSARRRDEFGHLAESFQSMSHQLTQLDRLKAEFVSVASHELKTPINVILGYLQLIDEGVYGPVSPKMHEIVRTLDSQTRSLSRLVHQLLDVSRFEAGGGKLDLRSTQLDVFLSEIEETFRVLASQRGIDFRVERNGTLPSEVLWDPDRISEVLGNLVANAFKFTERGGTVELHVDAQEQQVHLDVRDTGAGIPPQQLPHIFEKFYQADNQDAATQGGSGLGLAIARQIVVAHGGQISVESVLGVGTTFHLTLPLRAGGRVHDRPRTPNVGVPA